MILTKDRINWTAPSRPLEITFSGIRVRPLDRESIEISWEFSRFEENWNKVGFLLERAEVEHDQAAFTPISPIISNTRQYVDNPVNLQHNNRSWYYRVLAIRMEPGSLEELEQDQDDQLDALSSDSQIRPATATEDLFRASGCNPVAGACQAASSSDGGTPYLDPRLAAADRIRRVYQLSRSGLTRECTIYHKRTVGGRCLYCWDEIRERIKIQNCPHCYGTGYQGGYYRPIGPIYVKFEELSKEQSYTVWKTEANAGTTQARVPNFPHIRPRDLLIDNVSNQVWLIESPIRVAGGDLVVQQIAIVSAVDGDDIRRDLPKCRPMIPSSAVIGGLVAEKFQQHVTMEWVPFI